METIVQMLDRARRDRRRERRARVIRVIVTLALSWLVAVFLGVALVKAMTQIVAYQIEFADGGPQKW